MTTTGRGLISHSRAHAPRLMQSYGGGERVRNYPASKPFFRPTTFYFENGARPIPDIPRKNNIGFRAQDFQPGASNRPARCVFHSFPVGVASFLKDLRLSQKRGVEDRVELGRSECD